MAITLSTGVQLEIGKTLGSSFNITAITNSVSASTEAVATVGAGHGLALNDYIVITSGWDLLNGKVVRVKAVATNDVTLEGIITYDQTKYPAGAGVGSLKKITAWSQLSQLKSLSASGGEQQFADVTSLTDRTQKQVPTTRSAVTMTIDTFDDPSLAWYADVTAASDASAPYPLKMSFANGSKLVANAYWSLQKVPNVNQNEAMTTQISLSYYAEPVRYSS